MIVKKIYNYLIREISFFVDKVVNTAIWMFNSKREVIVLNVWLRHRGRKVRSYNWGDDINYVIIKYLSQKKVVNYMYSFLPFFRPLNYMCIGSNVDRHTNERTLVWGGGAMYGGNKEMKQKPLKVFAVRGPLTREYLLSQGVGCPEVYGDPAILLPLIYSCSHRKKYKMGVIPHYRDLEEKSIHELKELYGNDVALINLNKYNKWEDIIDMINECEFIVSSSLHGLIVSDAYKVPNVWVRLSDNITGGDFKYQDYYTGCKKTINGPINLIGKSIDILEMKKAVGGYKQPQYDINALLNSCPFIDTTVKKLMVNRIAATYENNLSM